MITAAIVMLVYVALAAGTGYLIGQVPFDDEKDRGPTLVLFSFFAPVGILIAVAWATAEAGARQRVKASRIDELRAQEHRIALATLIDQEHEVRRLR